MAENLMATPWFPNPELENAKRDFIYLSSLREDHPKVYHRANNLMSDILSNLNEGLDLQLDDLLALAIREQKKEDQMLDEMFGLKTGTPREDGARIIAFNKIYQKKSIIKRNLQKIEAVANGSKQGRIDITASFRDYLKTEINQWFKHNNALEVNKETLSQLTKNALYKAFYSADVRQKKNDPKEDVERAYIELAQLVEQMENNDPFIEEVFNLYFGSSLDDLIKKTKQKTFTMNDRKSVSKLISGERGVHGNLQERVLALISDSIDKNGRMIQAGKSGQKTDLMTLYKATFELPDELFQGPDVGDSVREHFIKRYRDFYDTLENQSGNIVEISAKNYNLTSDFFKENGGFTAQGAVSIKNLEKMLNAYGYNKYNKQRTDDLVFALTNIGPDTLSQGTEIVSHSLSLLIGYFLFDDIDMDKGLKVNAIHLFNLDGVYMPLSSFLFAAYDTLKNLDTLDDSMVSVSYQPASINYQRVGPGELTKELWKETTERKQSQTDLSIHFFKDFPKYIAERYSSLADEISNWRTP